MVVYTAEDVMAGQNYYFSRGGQHIGSIWGHGSYLAPDWSADYLHRMGLYIAARHQGQSAQEAARFSQADLGTVAVQVVWALVTGPIFLILFNRLHQRWDQYFKEMFSPSTS